MDTSPANISATTVILGPATFSWEEQSAKQSRRAAYYLSHGFVGLLTCLFNGFVILVYFRRHKIRRHISLVMLSMFVFCFLHGLIVGTVYPLQRIYRYDMNASVCIFTTLIMDLADKYVVLLLPVLAVERLIYLKYPFINSKRAKVWAICSVAGLMVFALLYSWLPLVKELGVPEGLRISSNNTERSDYIENFYKHYNCQYKLNKHNALEPIFTLIVSVLCVVVVVAAYVWMYMIAKKRLSSFASMTAKKQKRLNKAAKSVFLVAMTFVLTMLPYGVVVHIAAYCEKNTSDKPTSLCNTMTLESRFVSSILAHLGNLFAPMLFALLSPHIRQIMSTFIQSKVKTLSNKSINVQCRTVPPRPIYRATSTSAVTRSVNVPSPAALRNQQSKERCDTMELQQQLSLNQLKDPFSRSQPLPQQCTEFKLDL